MKTKRIRWDRALVLVTVLWVAQVAVWIGGAW